MIFASVAGDSADLEKNSNDLRRLAASQVSRVYQRTLYSSIQMDDLIFGYFNLTPNVLKSKKYH